MRLPPLQRAFASYLLNGDAEIRAAVRPSSKADVDALLGVYRNGYSARLVEVLGTDFPGVKALTGETEFETLARAYVAGHPSRGFSVRSLGSAFADFLRLTPPYCGQPALADMAAFETALADAFDAADAEPIRTEHLGSVPPPAWPTLTFRFHPSVRVQSLRTHAPEAWSAQNEGRAPQEPSPHPGDWLVWRQVLAVKYRPLDADESAALRSALAGANFSAVCETLAEHGPEEAAAFRAAGLVRAWIEAGLVTAIDHEGRLSA
jgi:hypothetical protein